MAVMENKKPNRCIACTVQQCAHHAENENYCSLDKIIVGTHEMNPTVSQCTDCESFILKSGECGTCRGTVKNTAK